MFLHSVKLVNFKSFGENDLNEVIIEPSITAIIGKNESGKTNVLDGISRINFESYKNNMFSEDIVNRNCESGIKNRYEVVLKSTNFDIKNGIDVEAEILISEKQCVIIGGSILNYYKENIHPIFDDLIDFLNSIGNNPFKFNTQEVTEYSNHKKELTKLDKIDLFKLRLSVLFLKDKYKNLDVSYQENFIEKYQKVISTLENFMSLFPVVFYRNADKILNVRYTFDEINKELKTARSAYPNSLLTNFVRLIDVSVDDFIKASNAGISSKQSSLRTKIGRRIEEKINKPFNEFYQTEQISLGIEFNNGIIQFNIRSNDGETLLLTERSNGLRWYLDLFIDAKANNLPNRNVVYLLDEPGVSLHVNAQKELLTLFEHLSQNDYQVVYTTHSPYMLDIEKGIQRIRAVVKDNLGYTNIYKTAYDSRINPDSQKDTLAPIIAALGMNLNDTFGPTKDKINIVVEGMSDYIYINTMIKVLEKNMNDFNIIASTGASNIMNICSILNGWGCKFLAVFDYDDEGVRFGEKLRKELLLEYKKRLLLHKRCVRR